VRIRGAGTWTTFVYSIDYNARGQREKIEYVGDAEGTGDVFFTEYTYDPLTFRLIHLTTTRTSDDETLQDLTYTYDPVGNIVAIKDDAYQPIFFNNNVVDASNEYEYDAIYRLIEATGREHASLGDSPRDENGVPIQNLPHENDSQAVRRYTETYEYDQVGNILVLEHDTGDSNSWHRGYRYSETSNRLEATNADFDEFDEPETYSREYEHDDHGNMISMPHITSIDWDFKDQMQHADLGGGGDVYFTYDAGGQRLRKIWEHSGIVEERIYLGGWELYRRHESGDVVLERETLHVMDDTRRIAMVETKTVDEGEPLATPEPRFRYQLGNHLGSAALEVDEEGSVISYEEYHSYGSTAYWSANSGLDVSQRRYRYTGKERDDETGLYYHGARYYAPWLGRWVSADPAALADGLNLYNYSHNNPVVFNDPSGLAGETPATPMSESEHKVTIPYQFSGTETIEEIRAVTRQAGYDFTGIPTWNKETKTWDVGNTLKPISPVGTASQGSADSAPGEPQDAELRAPSHRFRVWTGPFTKAITQLYEAKERSRNGLEWATGWVAIITISGLAAVENIPNLGDLFYTTLEYAAQVESQPTPEAKVEAIGKTGESLVSFVGTAGMLSEMGIQATTIDPVAGILQGASRRAGGQVFGVECAPAASADAAALGLQTDALAAPGKAGIFDANARLPRAGHFAVRTKEGLIRDRTILWNIRSRNNGMIPPQLKQFEQFDTFTPEAHELLMNELNRRTTGL
jgi:RHS repeat-associated protein